MTHTEQFIIELAKALQVNGIPAHRLEDTMEKVCAKLNVKADVYSSPNTLFVSFPERKEEKTHMHRFNNSELNFEKLSIIDAITKRVVKHELTTEEGIKEIAKIQQLPIRYGSWINIFSFGLSTSSAAFLFGGGYAEVIVSALIGLLIGVFIELIPKVPVLARLLLLISSAMAIMLAKFALGIFGTYSIEIATVTGLIILIPGFSFSLSITEMANGHTISGTSRFANAMIAFVMIAFGLGVGNKLMEYAAIEKSASILPEMPFWIKYFALLTVPAGFVVLFKAIPKHYIWMLIACTISYFSINFFSSFELKELSVFLATLTLGVACNGISRLTDNPVSLMLVPGIILLVPGSIGFKSISFLVNEQTLSGIETAFSTLITATALAAGLLFSNMLLKPKRAL